MKVTVSDVYGVDHFFEGNYWLEAHGNHGAVIKSDAGTGFANPVVAVFPEIKWAKLEDV